MGSSLEEICFPTAELLQQLIARLRELYPMDGIRLLKPSALDKVVHDTCWAARAHGSRRDRLAMAAATMFYDIIILHPLVDGNKRLATYALYTFLVRNGYYIPPEYSGEVYGLAILVARGMACKEDVYRRLIGIMREVTWRDAAETALMMCKHVLDKLREYDLGEGGKEGRVRSLEGC